MSAPSVRQRCCRHTADIVIVQDRGFVVHLHDEGLDTGRGYRGNRQSASSSPISVGKSGSYGGESSAKKMGRYSFVSGFTVVSATRISNGTLGRGASLSRRCRRPWPPQCPTGNSHGGLHRAAGPRLRPCRRRAGENTKNGHDDFHDPVTSPDNDLLIERRKRGYVVKPPGLVAERPKFREELRSPSIMGVKPVAIDRHRGAPFGKISGKIQQARAGRSLAGLRHVLVEWANWCQYIAPSSRPNALLRLPAVGEGRCSQSRHARQTLPPPLPVSAPR